MSKKLLMDLNGKNNGKFLRWLNNFSGEPRIAWYPSAGEDFRDLLYLHPKFAEHSPISQPEPNPPDIFLHTDYFPWSSSTFLNNHEIFSDSRTSISVKSIEELPMCNLPIDPQIVDFPQGSQATNRVLFLEIEICSNTMGSFCSPVVYAFVENAVFCAKKVLPLQGQFSHIVHVRFGAGCGGGGKSSGVWLINVLRKLQCEIFMTDQHLQRSIGDEQVYRLYPLLSGNEDCSLLEQIRVIKSEGWSGHGDISWNIVK